MIPLCRLITMDGPGEVERTIQESLRMSHDELPRSISREIDTPAGKAVGLSNRWLGGQYCAILTKRGLVGCGIYDINCANEFNFAFALAKGTPAKPLVEPEDLYEAKIVKVSDQARRLGIAEGMTGLDALRLLLDESLAD